MLLLLYELCPDTVCPCSSLEPYKLVFAPFELAQEAADMASKQHRAGESLELCDAVVFFLHSDELVEDALPLDVRSRERLQSRDLGLLVLQSCQFQANVSALEHSSRQRLQLQCRVVVLLQVAAQLLCPLSTYQTPGLRLERSNASARRQKLSLLHFDSSARGMCTK